MNPFSPYLNAVNRSDDEKLNILTFTTHEGFQCSMAKTKDRYTHVPSPESKKWDFDYRLMPSNIIEVDSASKAKDIDIIISHTLQQRNAAENLKKVFNVKHIALNHIFPNSNYSDFFIQEIKKDNGADVNVFTTKEQARLWGYESNESLVIPHGIDTEVYSGYNSLEMRILTVANFYKERGSELGYNFYSEVKDLIGEDNLFLNVGKSNDGSSSPACEKELVKYYQDSAIFLNTANRSVLPTSLLEAMSVGMPVITTSNETICNLIKSGENGFIAETPKDAFDFISQLMESKDLRFKIGNNARDTIKKYYDIECFVDKWKTLYTEILND